MEQEQSTYPDPKFDPWKRDTKFAEAFARAKLKAEVTFREISAVTGKSIGELCDFEKGRRIAPPIWLAEKIEVALNITDGHLVTLAAEERSHSYSAILHTLNSRPVLRKALAILDQKTDAELEQIHKDLDRWFENQKAEKRRELICQQCSSDYAIWFAPNELWNKVAKENEHFLCPTCFMNLAETRGAVDNPIWNVKPHEPNFLNVIGEEVIDEGNID